MANVSMLMSCFVQITLSFHLQFCQVTHSIQGHTLNFQLAFIDEHKLEKQVFWTIVIPVFVISVVAVGG